MIRIRSNICQRASYKRAACDLCARSCPFEGCITLGENSVGINKDVCTDCAICTAACPTGALSVEGLSDTELLKRLPEGKDLFIFCSSGKEGGSKGARAYLPFSGSIPVRVPCLAVLKESHLVSLALSGAGAIGLDLSGCGACALHTGKGAIEKNVIYAGNLLSALGRRDCVRVYYDTSGFEAGKASKEIAEITPGPVYSRRELFSILKERGFDNDGRTARVAGGIPERRMILLDALKKSPPYKGAVLKEGGFPARLIKITDACVLCGRCDGFCPAGALSRLEGEDDVKIVFKAGLCMACHECASLCPEGAIRYKDDIDILKMLEDSPETLFKKDLKKCRSCGAMFLSLSNDAECGSCRKRKKLDERINSILFGDLP